MGAVKRTPADAAFSNCVRERAGWRCERCNTYYPEGHGRQGLHCSHFHGRGNWSVRFDPENAFSHCYGCHSYFEQNPAEFKDWIIASMGEGAYELLMERKQDTGLGKMYKKTKGKGDIAKHYRLEHERMKQLRDEGEIGPIEFSAWL